MGEETSPLGKPPLILSGDPRRATRATLKQMPDDQLIHALADHAIDNLLGGTPARSVVDCCDGVTTRCFSANRDPRAVATDRQANA